MQNQSPSSPQWPQRPATQSQVPTAMSHSQYTPPPQYGAPPPTQMQASPWQKPTAPKKVPWLWIIACFVCLGLGYGVGHAGAADTPVTKPTTQAIQPSGAATTAPTTVAQPTAKPTQPPKWTTTHSYTGNGPKKTEIFAVPADW